MKKVIGKEIVAVFIVLLASIPIAFSLVPDPPHIFLGADPESQNVQAGGSATVKVTVYPQGDWRTGDVALALLNPPSGVTVTFNPVKMTDVQLEGFASNMTVKVAADAPQGKITLAVRGSGTGYPNIGSQTTVLNSTAYVELNIVAATGRTNTTTTTTNSTTKTTTSSVNLTTTKPSTTAGSTLTSTVTSVVTTTLTTTSVSTTTIISTQTSQQPGAELKPETNSYVVFGIGALTVSTILFISGVLLLASNRKHS